MFNKLIAKILGFSIANLKILPIFAPLFDRTPPSSGCSAVRLAHLLWEQGVVGSNPATPTTKGKMVVLVKSSRGVAQSG